MNLINLKKISLVVIISILLPAINTAASQPPPPPGGHGLDGNQPPSGGSTPIDSGTVILLGMAVAYGARKFYTIRRQKQADE